jgi:hypothetical protein
MAFIGEVNSLILFQKIEAIPPLPSPSAKLCGIVRRE